VPAALCHALWIYCALAFVLVEAVELVRLARRVRQYGWLGGVLVYDASQWARNFTFGMFYAFTVAALQRGADAAWLAAPQRAVAAWGQYVVLALLLIEAALLAWGRRSERA
jgi:hypothetical protein